MSSLWLVSFHFPNVDALCESRSSYIVMQHFCISIKQFVMNILQNHEKS